MTQERGKGNYVLVARLARQTEIGVGKLGLFSCPAGYYVYVGGARGAGGLAARLARHRRAQKKLHWHIDYLLQHAELLTIGHVVSREKLECVWARRLLALPEARILLPRFGASDCRCPAHLGYFVAEPESLIARAIPEMEFDRVK